MGTEVGSEVDALFGVGDPGGELATDGEPSAPGPSATGHGDLRLLGGRSGEELAGQAIETIGQGRIDAVAHRVEEPDVAAGGVERRRRLEGTPSAGAERPDVDLRHGDHPSQRRSPPGAEPSAAPSANRGGQSRTGRRRPDVGVGLGHGWPVSTPSPPGATSRLGSVVGVASRWSMVGKTGRRFSSAGITFAHRTWG